MAYTPSLSEMNQYLGADINPTLSGVNTDRLRNDAIAALKDRARANEENAVKFKQELSAAYSSVDPSKLEGTLENDRELLLNKMASVLDVLYTEPHAISNPNSQGFLNFKKTYNDFATSVSKSKLRKLTVSELEKQMRSADDFNTEENQKNIEVFKANFEADPDKSVLIPRMVSEVPYLDKISELTTKKEQLIQQNPNMTFDEIEREIQVNYEDRVKDLWENKRYINGKPFGEQWTKDIYNNSEFLKQNFDTPFEAFRFQAEVFKNPERVIGQKRKLLQGSDLLGVKSNLTIQEDNAKTKNKVTLENAKAANSRSLESLRSKNDINEEKKKQEGELIKVSFEAFKKIIEDSTDMDDDEKAQSIINVRNYLQYGTPLDEETTNKLIEAGSPTKPASSNDEFEKYKVKKK